MVRDRFLFLRQIAILSDCLMLCVAFLLVSWLRTHFLSALFVQNLIQGPVLDWIVDTLYDGNFTVPPESEIYFDVHINLMILSVGLWLLCLKYQGAYDMGRFTSLSTESFTVLKAALYATSILFAIGFIFRFGFFPRTIVVGFPLVSILFLKLEKALLWYVVKLLHQKGYGRKKLLIVGTGQKAEEVIEAAKQHQEMGFDVVGVVGEDRAMVGSYINRVKILGAFKDILEVLHKNEIDEVVFAVPVGQLENIKGALTLCEQEGVHTHIISDFFRTMTAKIRAETLYGLPTLSFSTVPNKEWQFFVKRIFDVLVASILLVLLTPVLLVIAVGIKLTSDGPILYHWRVVGLNKKNFVSYKFRTMVTNADALKMQLMELNEMEGPAFKMREDPRITGIGKWLRKFSLDELPQLFSVLKGDMSLVGPRPPLVTEIDKFDSWQRRKLSVKPGMTCLWQVRGRNQISDFDDWVRLDLEYIDEWSFWLDIKILLKTALVVVRGDGC